MRGAPHSPPLRYIKPILAALGTLGTMDISRGGGDPPHPHVDTLSKFLSTPEPLVPCMYPWGATLSQLLAAPGTLGTMHVPTGRGPSPSLVH